MRRIFSLLLSSLISAAAMSQAVTITFNGANNNRNYELVLDGTSYYSNSTTNANGTVAAKTIMLDNVQTGTHSLTVYRMRANANANANARTGAAVYTKDFTTRAGYDMNIAINGNGQITFTEKRMRNRTAGGRNRVMTPMTATAFNDLVQTVNARSYQSSKLTTIRQALATTGNYFTTLQVRQLVSMISSESSKLELAKLAYARITDPANIEQMYDVFASQSTRNAYDEYVSANFNANASNNGTYNNNGNSNNGTYNNGTNVNSRVAIDTYNYNQLLQTINNSTTASARYNVVYNAFNTGNYSYTSNQVRQLLSAVSSESDRLYLAKQAYLRVSDPSYFPVVYDLFTSVNSRSDLNTYVVNNGGVNTDINGTYNNGTYTKVAMSDADFNTIYRSASGNLFQSGKVSAVRDAFNNTGYVFSTYQVRQLLSLVTNESDRLVLAKTAYARVSDPANYAGVYDLLNSQASRTELDNYIRANGNVVMSGTETVAVVAMTDAAFSSFMFDQKLRIFRSAKVQAVKDLLNTSTNYFTTEQIKALVGEGKDEVDKIAIAKLAYRKSVDPSNFYQVVELIPSASGKADVNAYITANRY